MIGPFARASSQNTCGALDAKNGRCVDQSVVACTVAYRRVRKLPRGRRGRSRPWSRGDVSCSRSSRPKGTHDNRFAAWETPYWEEYFQRSDAIFYKLASGEIPVGLANKLSIESRGKFQVDVSKGHANAVRLEEVQRQRAAEAMLQASTQFASQSQPHMTTTNCMWVGNSLNCTSFH